MNPLDQPSRTADGSRREDYVLWRQRLSDKQDELRNVGVQDPGRVLDHRWSPEALFEPGRESLKPGDVDPVDVEPGGSRPSNSEAEVRSEGVGTTTSPTDIRLIGDATQSTTSEVASNAAEVEDLVRRYLRRAGPPPTTSADARSAGRGRHRRDTPPVDNDALLVAEPDHRLGWDLEVPEVARSSTVDPARNRPAVGEQLRALNRLRVDGELSDEEFNRRKRELFIRASTAGRPST